MYYKIKTKFNELLQYVSYYFMLIFSYELIPFKDQAFAQKNAETYIISLLCIAAGAFLYSSIYYTGLAVPLVSCIAIVPLAIWISQLFDNKVDLGDGLTSFWLLSFFVGFFLKILLMPIGLILPFFASITPFCVMLSVVTSFSLFCLYISLRHSDFKNETPQLLAIAVISLMSCLVLDSLSLFSFLQVTLFSVAVSYWYIVNFVSTFNTVYEHSPDILKERQQMVLLFFPKVALNMGDYLGKFDCIKSDFFSQNDHQGVKELDEYLEELSSTRPFEQKSSESFSR